MPVLQLSELASMLNPQKTVLFFGAGASIASGGPTAKYLATQLNNSLHPDTSLGTDLTEVASILENLVGREKLISLVRSILKPLQPTGGMLALPSFGWPAIYTTNYDQLVEKAYRREGLPLTPIRSNYDFGKIEASEGTPLYKLHGCLTQDLIDGHKARIVITERDYDEYESFRKVMYRRLALDLATKNVLVIGSSLADRHIRDQIQEAAKLRDEEGASGKVYALIYEQDENRAALLERRGVRVAFGALDDFLHALLDVAAALPQSDAGENATPLGTRLQISALDVTHARSLGANVSRMFNGGPATYADIENEYTFQRDHEVQFVNNLVAGSIRYLCITGVAGVGKTSYARRLMLRLADSGWHCWEHRNEFPLKHGEWLDVAARLSTQNASGVLLIDQADRFMRQVNELAAALSKHEPARLRLILTAENSQWAPRIKTPELFAMGGLHSLSQLSETEIEGLVALADNVASIRALADPSFNRLNRSDRVKHLRRRCAADMFVCLKNMFASETLDMILLQEYARLNDWLQEIYRYVSALEAAGAQVHRQLILRLMTLDPAMIQGGLKQLEGLVEEYAIYEDDGLYGWQTRHEVVARTIAQYKFAGDDELYKLFDRTADVLNPASWLELRTLTDICSTKFGIGRISKYEYRIALFEKLVALAPGERVPRHRLIATLLREGDYNRAEVEIRSAIDTVGMDPPLHRYAVRAKLKRATDAPGILDEDRVAMLRDAERTARNGIQKFREDKFAYSTYAEVGEAILERTGDHSSLDAAIALMREASERILDPDFGGTIRRYERAARAYPKG